jgi:putative IMPACT (imprinted ancient) family translation regulator
VVIFVGAIKGEALSDVVCVVVRYFGGVKLGAGGLIRAYGGAARLVLREAPKVTTHPKSNFKLTVDASYVGAIYEALSKAQALPSGEEYRADGSFAVSVTCDQAVTDELKESIKDATKGTVEYDMGLS